jgi:hypothetical protein
LQYLGRGWSLDDLEESTNISGEVHCIFFCKFIDFGSTMFYEKHVVTPVNIVDAISNITKFAEAGFPGCIGSIYCTHITTE